MKIPMVKKAAAALLGLYDDSALVVRTWHDETGRIVEDTVYPARRCHLSVQRGLGAKASSAFKQTGAEGRAAVDYAVYFPPGSDIKAGDLISVSHCGRVMTGRAGQPAFGKLGVRVSLGGSDPL